MKLQEIKYPPQLSEIFAGYKQIGVVLDLCILEFDEVENLYENSQEAALLAMKIFSQRYLEKLILLNPDRDVSGYFQIKIDENVEPIGKKIDYKEFLGKGFDFLNNRVNLFRYSENSRGTMAFDGLVRALLDPPYSVRLMERGQKLSVEYGIVEQKRMTGFLFEFLAQVLYIKDLTDFDELCIFSWSDDWSNYFNAGKEWWGTFYWTLLESERKTITILGASQTD